MKDLQQPFKQQRSFQKLTENPFLELCRESDQWRTPTLKSQEMNVFEHCDLRTVKLKRDNKFQRKIPLKPCTRNNTHNFHHSQQPAVVRCTFPHHNRAALTNKMLSPSVLFYKFASESSHEAYLFMEDKKKKAEYCGS